jgi:hypothetical protein
MASKASSTSSKLDDIVVLSWNICFGCMIHSDKDKTGIAVVKQCIDKSTTHYDRPCMNNLLNFISNIPAIYNFPEYDFIGLQESSGWQKIIQDPRMQQFLTTGGGYLNYVQGKSGPEDIITFYNSNKYILKAVKFGFINHQGRPYTILFLTDKRTDLCYIVVNMHNDHNISKNDLSDYLSNNLQNAIKIDSLANAPIENLERLIIQNKEQPIVDIIASKEHHIILMGDTNENTSQSSGSGKYWNKNFIPFLQTPFHEINNTVVTCPNPPPLTCCGSTGNGYPFIGDYVLISNNLEFIIENHIPREVKDNHMTNPVSDHLPALSIIKHLHKTYHKSSASSSSAQPSVGKASTTAKQSIASSSSAQPSHGKLSNKVKHLLLNIKKNSKVLHITYKDQTFIVRPEISANDKVLNIPLQKDNKTYLINEKTNQFIFPQGTPTPNKNLVLVEVPSYNTCGYIQQKYIINDGHGNLTLGNFSGSTRTIRLLNLLEDPNASSDIIKNGNYIYTNPSGTKQEINFRGDTIKKGTTIKFPDGTPTDNGYVLVRDKKNLNMFGYIKMEHIKPIQIGSGKTNRKSKQSKSSKTKTKKY